MKYVALEQILKTHAVLLERYGGSTGIRDEGLLRAAVDRPRTTVGGKGAYPKLHDKAAALFHSLLFNHAFVDGNKRIAFAACHLTLLLNGWEIKVGSQEIYDFMIEAIREHYDWKRISAQLKKWSVKI